MNAELSKNTQAILLLTAPLIAGGGKTSLRPLGPVEYEKLAQQLLNWGKEPADLLERGAGGVLSELPPVFDQERIRQLLERGFLLSQVLEHWQARAIWVVSRADRDYPKRFKQRLGKSAPPVIYGCGNSTLLDNGGLAVVGSRNADDPLIVYSEDIGRLAAESGCAVISGGARGVDQAAMQGALVEGGIAVGVLADKLERAAMDRGNRDVLMDDRLVLISACDPRAGFNAGNSMQRNKLVYALADAGLVVESDYNKGGTWAGAVEQLNKLRHVPLYTRADGEIGKGLKALQQKGAYQWPAPRTPDEFRAVLSDKPADANPEAPKQTSLIPNGEAVVQPNAGIAGADTVGQIAPRLESVRDAPAVEVPPGDVLFKTVEELIGSIDTPTTDYAVAKYLDISQKQARDWLKRLVREDKYRQLNKPVRYDRIPSERLFS